MDLWGAGINFILDGGKNQKGQKKILRILGQVSKMIQGMLGSLSRTGFFHTADDSRSACAQNNIHDGYSCDGINLHIKYKMDRYQRGQDTTV